jgi:hypothetical protein
MLTKRFTKTKLVAIMLVVLFAGNILAKPAEDERPDKIKRAIENLAAGIQSENDGVRDCCIFFAGYYEFNELTGVLVKQLKREQNPDTKVLILLSLYRIGDKESIEAAKQLVRHDDDQVLKGMFSVK